MPYFVLTVEESDGNDCTLAKVIVQSHDSDDAARQVIQYIRNRFPEAESDGDTGIYFPCSCLCEHGYNTCEECFAFGTFPECEGHGGIYVSGTVYQFASMKMALKDCAHQEVIDLVPSGRRFL